MDNHIEFDTVKAEKANALAKYRRVRNIAKLFQLLEVFVALALISWCSTWLPSAVKLTREYLIVFSAYLFNPHVVFVIGNVIVAALYVISRHFDGAESTDSASSCAAGLVSEEYHKCSTINHNAADNSGNGTSASDNEFAPSQPETEDRSEEEKQMVCFDNAVAKTECEAAAAAIETATKQLQRFQRTQSAKLKRQISMTPLKEYRRSETEISRLQVTTEYGQSETGQLQVTSPNHGRRPLTSYETVDQLSNEEFRLTVEAFIEKQRSFLTSQRFAQ